MELAVAFVGGASAKIYDDIVDDGIPVSDVVKESLKGVQWMSLTALSLNDFNFAAFMYLMTLLHYFTSPDSFSNSYEFSLLLIFPVLFLLNYKTITYFKPIDCILFVGLTIAALVDHIWLDENISNRKFVIRTCELIGGIGLLVASYYLQMSVFIQKIISYTVAYLLLSSLFQLYRVYCPSIQEQAKKEDIPIKAGEDLNAGPTKST